jgi:uncharacterized protein (DUF924 family)
MMKQAMVYNHKIAAELKEVFTPLTKRLEEELSLVSEQNVLQYLVKTKVCSVHYSASRYDINSQLPPVIKEMCHERNFLNDNEIHYFSSFVKQVNESADLKPYNIAELLTGRFDEYLWCSLYADTREPKNNHSVETVVVPLGEYEIENYLLLLLTSKVLLCVVDMALKDKGSELENKYWPLLSTETSQGRKKLATLPEMISALDTLKEGIQSYLAVLSSLTARKIPGRSFESLLQEIVDEGMPQKIATKVPFNYTLPSIRQGVYFEGIFRPFANSVNENGKLTFSPAFLEYCKETQSLYRNSRLVGPDGKRNVGLLGTGCPMAQKMSGYDLIGINYIGKSFLKVFRLLKEKHDFSKTMDSICPLRLETPEALSFPILKPDAFDAYNVNIHEHNAARERVRDYQKCQQLTEAVLRFWFGDLALLKMPSQSVRESWFTRSSVFDLQIWDMFGSDIKAVKYEHKYLNLHRTPLQTLAIIIILDQFSRNVYRNSKESYSSDNMAVQLCLEAIESCQDCKLPPVMRWFLYMPLQHSECLEHQQKSVACFTKLLADLNEVATSPDEATENRKIFENVLKNAIQHYEVIKHFGHFPSRNKDLNRSSTEQEIKYIDGLPVGNYYNAHYFENHKGELIKMEAKIGNILRVAVFILLIIYFLIISFI